VLDERGAQALADCGSVAQLAAQFGRLCEAWGFELWAFSMPVAAVGGEPQLWSIDNFPATLRAARIACYFAGTGTPRASWIHHGLPQAWLAAAGPTHGAAQRTAVHAFHEAAHLHRVHAGLCVPVSTATAQPGLLTLATQRSQSEQQLRALRPHALLLSRYLHIACLPHIERFKAGSAPRLSTRELECLSWAAQGKTTWEIGRVLLISEHTAVYHLRNALRKLGAVNRQQAIAKAVASGLLVPGVTPRREAAEPVG
jgi:DNA-binding CsgD family transcriptional regulator